MIQKEIKKDKKLFTYSEFKSTYFPNINFDEKDENNQDTLLKILRRNKEIKKKQPIKDSPSKD